MVAGLQPKDRKSHETVHQRYRAEASGRNHHQPGDPDFAGLCGHNAGELLSAEMPLQAFPEVYPLPE
jgi:hypothetical protein